MAELPVVEGMIDAQGIIFLTAGFETTANTLGSLIYHMATYPEVQNRVYEEICDLIGSDETITHENIKDLHYLEACIMETLRHCPPVTEHDRTCVNDCVVNGIIIKKGVRIQMPNYASHFDEEFFPQPKKYMPERFLKENAEEIVPYTWRPFGAGNRVCIGQRFAIMEMKIFMAKLISKLKINKTPRTEHQYDRVGAFILVTYPDIVVNLEKRSL